MAHDALTKLIAENKERPIAEAPRDGSDVILRFECGGLIVASWDCEKEVWDCGDRWLEDDELTHFRPLPDDRLALVAECLDDGYQTIIKHFPEAEVLVNKIRQKVAAIAEAKE